MFHFSVRDYFLSTKADVTASVRQGVLGPPPLKRALDNKEHNSTQLLNKIVVLRFFWYHPNVKKL